MRILYRIRQAWQASTIKPHPSELSLVKDILTPPMLASFNQLKPYEQAHSIRILHQMFEAGEQRDDLLVAALLHDIGKIRYPLHFWERVVIVLSRSLFPKASRNWGTGEPRGWKRPFVVAENHPDWGSEIALQAGASPITAAIIKRHQDPIIYPHNGNSKAAGEQDQISETDLLVYKLQLLDHQN